MASDSTVQAPLIVRRTVNAPRERVFAAWTTPEDLARWYAPGDGSWTVRVLECDPRVGGKLVVEFGPAGEQPYLETAEYLAIDPPARLEFRAILHSGDELIEDTHVVVNLIDRGGGTEIVVSETGFDAERRAGRESGWGETLDHLVALFA